jgi:hypothetical protein
MFCRKISNAAVVRLSVPAYVPEKVQTTELLCGLERWLVYALALLSTLVKRERLLHYVSAL